MRTEATASDVRVRRLEPDEVAAIRTWRYGGRDEVYDPGEDVVPERGYHALVDATTNELVGYCCFGPEARVPGLDAEDGTLDMGVGLRPDLVGGGWGAVVTRRVLEHGARHHGPERFRVAILAWNERSLRTVRRSGFRQTDRLELDDGRVFVVMEGDGQRSRPDREDDPSAADGIHPDPYGHLAQRFAEHYGTLRGAVRFALLAEQLDAQLPAGPCRIVDVGGGAGHQAIRLARLGHAVTVVDPSSEMLGRASAAIEREGPDVRQRLRLVQATGTQAAAVLRERYEVLLCHAVLPYVADPEELVGALAPLAAPGGLLSLVFKNADALAMRPALEGRWADALAAFDATEDVGGLGVSTRAQTRSDVMGWVATAGFDVVEWFGIRVMSDHLLDVPADDHLAAVLPVEAVAAQRDPYRALGRLIHVLATRRDV